MSVVSDLLGDPSYGMVREVRASQIQMAETIESILTTGGVYVVEGPVGCGKTFAYLTPSLLAAGRRVVVATAKKGLQDQIKKKDLPFLVDKMRAALGNDFEQRMQHPTNNAPFIPGTVIKGKANYACHALALKHKAETDFFTWLAKGSGEWADYPGRRPMWHPYATAEGCVGRACAHHSTCAYARAKLEAPASKVVVVNHHLLGSDMYFGHGKLVGGPYDVLIVDEAHKLADGIRAAFTLRVTEGAATEIDDALDGMPWNFPAAKALVGPWKELFDTVPQHITDENGYRVDGRSPHLREVPVFPGDHDDALGALDRLDVELGTMLKRYNVSEEGGLESCDVEDEEIRNDLAQLTIVRRKAAQLAKGVRLMQGQVKPLEDEAPEAHDLRTRRILGNTALIGSLDRRGMALQAMPVTLGGLAKNYFAGVKSVVLTSATLAVNRSFDHLDDVVGVRPTKTMILPPTFDYDSQGFAFVPSDLPNVRKGDESYQEIFNRRLSYCARLVRLSKGGAFVLATSYEDLNEHAFHLARNTPHRVFAQVNEKIRQRWYQDSYDQPPDANPWFGEPQSILDRFLNTPDAVLVGAKSFWEGVDVVGEQLRLVVITKLPFPNISDPLVKARRRPWVAWALEQEKTAEDAKWYAWAKVDLVDMLIDLRQGIGRLIRSRDDRGVIAILDSRAIRSKYSDVIKRSMEFKMTDQFAKCEKWLPRFTELLKTAKAGR